MAAPRASGEVVALCGRKRIFGRKRGRDAAGVDAAQGLLPVLLSGPLAERGAQQPYGTGEQRLQASAGASVQLQGPSGASMSSPKNAAEGSRPDWDVVVNSAIRATVQDIVRLDNHLSEQAVEVETSRHMDAMRQLSERLQERDAVHDMSHNMSQDDFNGLQSAVKDIVLEKGKDIVVESAAQATVKEIVRAKVKEIVRLDSRLSAQAVEEETSMHMEAMRQRSRRLQQEGAFSLTEGRAQQLSGPGTAAAASVQLRGPSAGSRSGPRNAAQVRRPERDGDNDDKGVSKEDKRGDVFNALEREIRAKVEKIVSEDSRLSEQAVEEETSRHMEGLRQWSRHLRQQDAVLRE